MCFIGTSRAGAQLSRAQWILKYDFDMLIMQEPPFKPKYTVNWTPNILI